jgi:hypothetical protein
MEETEAEDTIMEMETDVETVNIIMTVTMTIITTTIIKK